MNLQRLAIQNLRVLQALTIHPSPSVNLLVGPNGSGKTSLLEGIHILGVGRSFRTRHIIDIVTRGCDGLLVVGDLLLDDDRNVTIGVERNFHESRVRISGQDIHATSQLAQIMPLFLITPHSQWLLKEGAFQRRRLVDWTLFHVEPGYLAALQRYRGALRQRNAELKKTRYATLTVWTQQLVYFGRSLHALRQRYLQEILPRLNRITARLMQMRIDLAYDPGWNGHSTLDEALARSLTNDRLRGYTSAGPHRADLRLQVDGIPAQRVLSRGEGKLLALSFLLSQVDCVIGCTGKVPLVLVDDLSSELDAESQMRFLQELAQIGAQTFLTALSSTSIDTSCWPNAKQFHVKHGTCREIAT